MKIGVVQKACESKGLKLFDIHRNGERNKWSKISDEETLLKKVETKKLKLTQVMLSAFLYQGVL